MILLRKIAKWILITIGGVILGLISVYGISYYSYDEQIISSKIDLYQICVSAKYINPNDKDLDCDKILQ